MADCILNIFNGEGQLELPCQQLTICKSVMKDMIVMGTREHMSKVSTWIKLDNTRLWINPESILRPDDHGYRLEGSRMLARGVWVAWVRTTDPRCVWPDTRLYDALNEEPFETPLMEEWMPHVAAALRPQYLKPFYGYKHEGEYLDHGLSPVVLDRIISGLVKRKILKI